MFVKPVQQKNALSSIVVTLLPIVILAKLLHSENARSPIVITLSGIAFKDYTVMFYSVISLYVAGRVTDFIMVRGNWAKSVYIISEKHEEIARAIIEDMDRGVTGIYGKGIYENKDKMLLMCIVKSREIPNLLERIKSLDGKAFTVIADVKEVHGEGFR